MSLEGFLQDTQLLGMRPLHEMFVPTLVPSWDSWEQDVEVVGDPAEELDKVNAEMSRVKEELEAAERDEKDPQARPSRAEKEKRNIYFVSPTSKCPPQRPPATHRAQMNLTPKAGFKKPRTLASEEEEPMSERSAEYRRSCKQCAFDDSKGDWQCPKD